VRGGITASDGHGEKWKPEITVHASSNERETWGARRPLGKAGRLGGIKGRISPSTKVYLSADSITSVPKTKYRSKTGSTVHTPKYIYYRLVALQVRCFSRLIFVQRHYGTAVEKEMLLISYH
jgi:hypothetical protein